MVPLVEKMKVVDDVISRRLASETSTTSRIVVTGAAIHRAIAGDRNHFQLGRQGLASQSIGGATGASVKAQSDAADAVREAKCVKARDESQRTKYRTRRPPRATTSR